MAYCQLTHLDFLYLLIIQTEIVLEKLPYKDADQENEHETAYAPEYRFHGVYHAIISA